MKYSLDRLVNAMNNIGTVIRFTFLNKIKGKAFLISTLVFLLIISVGVNLPYIISQFSSGSGDSQKVIGYYTSQDELANETGKQLAGFFDKLEGSGLKVVEYSSVTEAQMAEKLQSGELYGYLTFGEVTESGFPVISFKSEKLFEYSIASQLETALQVIRQEKVITESGLPENIVAQLNAPIVINPVQISSAGGEGLSEDEQGINMIIVYGLIIVLFMAIIISGQVIASEVTAEKSSRVMEVLITSVSPVASMFGKITGMFLLLIMQLAIYIGTAVINVMLPHNQKLLEEFNFSFSGLDPMLLIYAIVYFLAGFFLFAVLYAAVGSIVSRTEDLGQAIMPMTFISLAGFYIAIFSISTPDSMLVKVSSFIPVLSPFVMILRIGLTNIPTWEILVSLAILFATIYAGVILCARIYRTGVLMYGKRPTLKELSKAMKAYK